MRYINTRYYYALVACLLGVLTLHSCSEDEDTNTDLSEWTANYVYLQNDNYLAVEIPYNVRHNPLGIEEFTYTFSVKAKKPLEKDVVVLFEVNSDEIPVDKIEILPKQVTLKAGSITSEDLTLKVTDWSLFVNDKEAKLFNISLSVSQLQTDDKTLRISTNRRMKSIQVNKAAYSLIASTLPSNWNAINRSGWKASASHVYGSSYTPDKAIDDDQKSTWFGYGKNYNDGACWLNVELDSPKNLTGFSITRENAFGGGYSVKQATIQIKKEGDTEWTTYEDVYTFSSFNSSAPQYAVFGSEIQKVKEFRLNILSRVDYTGLADLNLFETK